MVRIIYLVLLHVVWATTSQALTVEANVFYFSDSMTYASTPNTYGRTFWDICPSLNLDKKGRFAMGWSYGSMSFSDSPGGTATTLAITDMGPKVTYFLNKRLTWPLSLTYGLISKGSYSAAGGSALEERGTSLKVEAGYTPQFTDHWFIGAKLIWYKASFNEEVANQTALSQVTNSRTAIYPALSALYRWD